MQSQSNPLCLFYLPNFCNFFFLVVIEAPFPVGNELRELKNEANN